MRLTGDLLQINPASIAERIRRFISDYAKKAKAKGIVLGVSGGVDSATTIALSTMAIGEDKVLGIYMPEEETLSKRDHDHVRTLAKEFRFRLKTVTLTEALRTLYRTIPDYKADDKTSRGNLKARMRMVTLYYYANYQDRIVAGSSDKSETMIGYFTKWGDAAADIAPIMDLYKTQVRQLALHIGVPAGIVKKRSTPALWPDQFAEEDIGLKYETLDLILYGLEHFMPIRTIAEQLHLPTRSITAIKEKWLQTEHKRQMPLTTKLQYRTINADFRLARAA